MNGEELLEELLLLPTAERERFFALVKARPVLRQEFDTATNTKPAPVAPPSEVGLSAARKSSADYLIIFDGGSRGNPGEGYGSYEVTAVRTGKSRVERLNFGDNMTNNEAEYETLIGALRTLAERIEAAGKSPATYVLDIRGDSQLVLYQVLGKWKAKDVRMATYRDSVRRLLQKFKGYTLTHHDRSKSVAALGH